MILEQEVFVSGFVDISDDLFVCFEENSGKRIKLFPVIFHDNIGEWHLNMWYAEAVLSPHYISVRDCSELKDTCQDNFLMLWRRIDTANTFGKMHPCQASVKLCA